MKQFLLLLVSASLIPCLSLLQAAEIAEKETKLEFRLVVDEPTAETETLPLKRKAGSVETPKPLITKKAADFGGADLKSVTTVSSKSSHIDSTGKELTTESTAVAVTLSKPAGDRMKVWSEAHLGQRLAIVVDGQILMAPTVQSPFGAKFMISGDFSRSEAQAIVEKLRPQKKSVPKLPQ